MRSGVRSFSSSVSNFSTGNAAILSLSSHSSRIAVHSSSVAGGGPENVRVPLRFSSLAAAFGGMFGIYFSFT